MKKSCFIALSALTLLFCQYPALAGSGSAPVRIVNENPIPVIDVGTLAKTPFNKGCNISINSGDSDGYCEIDVPAGEIYVIEYVSTRCASSSAADSFPQFSVTIPQNTFDFFGLESRGVQSGYNIYSNSKLVKLYVPDNDPNLDMRFIVYHTEESNTPTCWISIMGYSIQAQ